MTEFTTKEALARIAVVTPAPHLRSEIDRWFELPTGLYAATVVPLPRLHRGNGRGADEPRAGAADGHLRRSSSWLGSARRRSGRG
jgi:hypothetical protein